MVVVSKDFIATQNKDSDDGYVLEADVQYFKKLQTIYKNLSFLPKRMNYNIRRITTLEEKINSSEASISKLNANIGSLKETLIYFES